MKLGKFPKADVSHKEECYMTFVNGRSAYTVASLSWSRVGGSMNQKRAPCEAPKNLSPLLRKDLETNITLKSTTKASSSSYVTSRPQELSLEERHRVTRLSMGGCGCGARHSLL